MAVPFRKVSKTSKRMRRTHYKVKANGFYLDWINKDNNKSIFNEEFANKIKNKIYKKERYPSYNLHW